MNNQNTMLDKMTLIAYRSYLHFIKYIRTSKMLHRCIFGYRPCCNIKLYGGYWDWTTLILKKALRQSLLPGSSFLDMGSGPVGVLAIYSSLHHCCKRVTAVDQIPFIVDSAKKTPIYYG